MIKKIDKNTSVSELKAIAGKFDTISFDIFDTLLYRKTEHPTDVFTIIDSVAEEYCFNGSFRDMRVNAEKLARATSSREDITLDEIYKNFSALSGNDANRLMKLEMEVEASVICPDKLMTELFQFCVSAGKNVLIISDMYLPTDFISKVLDSFGLRGYELYVSSDVMKTKASGSIYRMLLSEKRLNEARWLHIGDNECSDCIIPASMGINVLHYNNGKSQSYHNMDALHRLYLFMKFKIKSIVR